MRYYITISHPLVTVRENNVTFVRLVYAILYAVRHDATVSVAKAHRGSFRTVQR